MRASKRIIYTTINHGVNWLEPHGSKDIEEYPSELKLTWWQREIPPFLMLIFLTWMLGKIFGVFFVILLCVVAAPVIVISLFLTIFDGH